MAARTFVQAIVAGASFDPLDSWQYQYTERPSMIKLNHQSTAVGLRATLSATEITLLQDSPVPAGGVAGTIPSDFTVPPVIEKVAKGKRLSLLYTNPTVGTITVSGVVELVSKGSK